MSGWERREAATAVLLSSLEPRPPGEKKKTEREGTECVILKWRILVNISLATAQRKTPSVSMVTGTPPCSPLCGREEAPASERPCRTDRRPAVVDIMNRCIM